MNPNKRPPPSSAGTFDGGDGLRDATKRARDFPDGKILRPGQEQPGNVLLVRVTDIVHPVTVVALQQIFSRFGKVNKIVMFDKGSGFQALVQMADVYTAMNAHEAADMQEMYSGCNLIRVGYSNLQNVTVKGNTERSWDFNIGPPLEGALPPGTSPSATAGTGGGNTSGGGGGGSGGGYRHPVGSAHIPQATPPTNPHRHASQQNFPPQQQFSPYSAAQQQQPYAPPQQQQSYASPPQPTYGTAPSQSTYTQPQAPQQQFNNGASPYSQHHQPNPSSIPTGGGSYVPPQYAQQQGYPSPYAQAPPPFSQRPSYTPQPYGQQQQNYPFRGAPQRSGDESSGGGGSNGAGNTGVGAGGGLAAGAAGAAGGYSRAAALQQPPANYYPSSPGVLPPQGGPYGGSIPFSSERGHAGFGAMGMGAGRPIPQHSSRTGRGGVGGGLGAGGPGGGGGVSQGRAGATAGYAGAGGGGNGTRALLGAGGVGGGNGLLQAPPHHRQVPAAAAHDAGAYRSQMRLRSSERKSSGVASDGATKQRSRVPRLDPLHIQALTAPPPPAKRPARHREPEEEETAVDPQTNGTSTVSGGRGRAKTSSGFAKPSSTRAANAANGSCSISRGGGGSGGGGGSSGSGNEGKKKANKREAAEMLGPDTADQLAAATARVRVSDAGEEDGEGKRANKREAAEMLGPDATDQLAAATARVRVSDDGDGEEAGPSSSTSPRATSKERTTAITASDTEADCEGPWGDEAETGGGDRGREKEKEKEENDVQKEKRKTSHEAEGGNADGDLPATDGVDEGVVNEGGADDVIDGDGDGDDDDEPSRGSAVGSGIDSGVNDVNVVDQEGKADQEGQRDSCEGTVTIGKELVENAKVVDNQDDAPAGEATEVRGKRRNAANGVTSPEKDENSGDNRERDGSGTLERIAVQPRSDDAAKDADAEDVKASEELEGVDGDKEEEEEVEAKVKSGTDDEEGEDEEQDEDDDDNAAREAEAERVDVGAWAAAAPASRSPILMVLHVDAHEVSPGALCQLFGLYGDVMKVKLVSSRGMALVQMRYAVQAVNAQRLLDQTPLCGMVLEVKASSQWTINDPTATDFSGYQGVHRYETTPSPEDTRYRDSLSPPCSTLVVDNVYPDASAEAITSIFAKHGVVSSVDLDTHAKAPLDATIALPRKGGSNSEPKASVQALVHMEADGGIGATETAVHALVMTHNLTLHERRLRVSFLSEERHVQK